MRPRDPGQQPRDPEHRRVEAWQVLADTVLQREALSCRLGAGLAPNDFAGLYVGDAEVQRALRELPGLRAAAPPTPAVPGDFPPVLAEARREFAASLAGGSAFARLVRAAGLDVEAAEILALLVAVEFSPHRMRLVGYVQDNVQLPRLTLATLAGLRTSAGSAGDRQVAPGAPLRVAELVEVPADGPWATRICAPAQRVLWQLRGCEHPDGDLPAGTLRLPSGPAAPPSRPAAPPPAGADAQELLLVTGADRDSRRAAVADRMPGRGRLVCPVPGTRAEWSAVVREASVGGLVVVLELDGPPPAHIRDGIAAAAHLSWVLSSERELALDALPDRRWTEVRLESGIAGPECWAAAFGVADGPAADALAADGEPAAPVEVPRRLTRTQLALVAAASGGDRAAVGAAVRRLAGGHLDGLAVRVRPRRGWDDLVLPADQTDRLRELTARYRRRETVYRDWGFPPLPATGIVALFSGASGTGKTLAAEIVAGDLGLDLYKVDLSAVVSKYIGETEKNLERIFSAAATGDLVLFFDEADALFGKRSEVSDAHDRYANIEVAYLLQRLESYQGIVIMATNLQRNMDQAFLRRISVAVDFEEPDQPQRRAIWARVFPAGAPIGDLDLDFLARQFRITGGVIHNAALGAAFLAADDGGTITMERIALALKREFQKLGRLRTQAEFERYFDLVNGDADAAPAR